jgi:hypothetical protein
MGLAVALLGVVLAVAVVAACLLALSGPGGLGRSARAARRVGAPVGTAAAPAGEVPIAAAPQGDAGDGAAAAEAELVARLLAGGLLVADCQRSMSALATADVLRCPMTVPYTNAGRRLGPQPAGATGLGPFAPGRHRCGAAKVGA